MPETRGEWLVLLGGLVVIGLLIAAVVFRPKHSDPTTAPRIPPTSAAPTTTAAPAPLTTVTTTAATTTAETTTSAPPPPPRASGTVRLRLAARADTWLSIRRTAPTPALLFEGTLAQGDSRSYSGTAFRVRFGAAANVSATLNGKPLRLFGGTYSVTIDRAGVGTRSA